MGIFRHSLDQMPQLEVGRLFNDPKRILKATNESPKSLSV